MQKNYLILAYKNPIQIKNLIHQLNDGKSNFYIHIDKKIAIEPFQKIIINNNYTKFIENRETVIYCDYSMVKATINLLKAVLDDKREGYCFFISGQDYPIKSNQAIDLFLLKNQKKEFIDIFELPSKNWFENGLDRINSYKFNLSNKKNNYVVCPTILQKQFYRFKTIKILIKLLINLKIGSIFKIFIKRNHPSYIKPCGGNSWWTLSVETVKEILFFINKNPNFLIYHKYSLIPDEMFFQTIVNHLFQEKRHLIQDTTTFIDWERENLIGTPILTINDYDLLINKPENKLFARKFDVEIDSDILNKLKISL